MEFFSKIPVMDRTALRELKKSIDFSFKEFSRAYGDAIEGFFDPLLYFLIILLNTGSLLDNIFFALFQYTGDFFIVA